MSRWLAVAALMTISSAAAAQTPSAPCDRDSSFHALDFWIGTWDVFDTNGKLYAHQKVSPTLGGCAILAEWTGPSGDHGLGLFAFDPTDKRWKQSYVGDQIGYQIGYVVRRALPGYRGPGLQFTRDQPPGSLKGDRITLEPLDGGRVRELFEESSDAGKTWKLVFNAEFRPAKQE